jgi:hypothetical protein
MLPVLALLNHLMPLKNSFGQNLSYGCGFIESVKSCMPKRPSFASNPTVDRQSHINTLMRL